MMRLPTMTTAIYRLRPRQMLKMMKGIFAVIVRIQFGYSSDSWFKAQIRFMKNSRLSSWGESLNFTVCTFHRARSGSTDDKLSQRFLRYPTAQITVIYRHRPRRIFRKKTKTAEPSFFFYIPRFNPVSLSVKVCPYFYNLLFSIYSQCFQSILMFPIDNVSSRCSQFTYNLSNYEQTSRTIRYDLYIVYNISYIIYGKLINLKKYDNMRFEYLYNDFQTAKYILIWKSA